MDLTRLAEKRGTRTRTWASVCGQLFGDGAVGDRAVAEQEDDDPQ
ncbi:hypothetical protein [Halorussus litoreus]|nr:hypothetical protein [Halorussus litoreus]